MAEENKGEKAEENILCKRCGNDKFIIRGSMLGGFSTGCSECGEGHIFGSGLTARDIFFILKEEDKKV